MLSHNFVKGFWHVFLQLGHYLHKLVSQKWQAPEYVFLCAVSAVGCS